MLPLGGSRKKKGFDQERDIFKLQKKIKKWEMQE